MSKVYSEIWFFLGFVSTQKINFKKIVMVMKDARFVNSSL